MPANVKTLDLNFQGIPGAIASYLLPHSGGVALIEAGPGSSTSNLEDAVRKEGYRLEDVTDVLLTHIHLDHAGAAGWLALRGARIHVHPNGAAHMVNPEKLITSATRIYGDRMQTLWGDFLPVPEEQLSIPQDGQEITIGELSILPLDTPGHANHHYSYLIDDIAFVGDVGGVRLGGMKHLRLPMPPPEFHIEKWRASADRLDSAFARMGTKAIAPTHFGIHTDVEWHLGAVRRSLDEVEAWMMATIPKGLSPEELRNEFITWADEIARRNGVGDNPPPAQGAVNPPFMSADGIHRYYKKHVEGAGAT